MRRVPPAEWIDLHETVVIDGPVTVNHPHPALQGCSRCRLVLVDYAPFEDVLEIRLNHDGAEIRLLVDDPQEIRIEPGASIEIRTRNDLVDVRQAMTTASMPEDLPANAAQA